MSNAASAIDDAPLTHGYVERNGVRLHYVAAGRGPLIVLLHGFPEFWYAFRRQIPALVAAGYRVVAPDLRGYNLSAKPRGVGAYTVKEFVADLAALIRALGTERASVVGHDWGGGIGWAFAMQHPELLDRLVVMNCPHPERFARGIWRPEQLRKSWYMFFFQLPSLPELLVRRRDFAMLLGAFRREIAPHAAFSEEELAQYRQAFAQPGALRAMIHAYRALARPRGQLPFRTIDHPVLVLWGERDRHLSRELAAPSPHWVPRATVERLPDASHWLHHEYPERINQRIVSFLSSRSREA